MSEKKNDRNVVFRRIGGRIVPIALGAGALAAAKDIKSLHKHNATNAKAYKLTNKAKSADSILHFGGLRPDNFSEHRDRLLKRFKPQLDELKFYSYDIKKVKPFTGKGNAFVQMESSSGLRDFIQIADRSRMTFAHELGHAQQFSKNSLTARLRMYSQKFNTMEDKIPSFNRIINSTPPNSLKRKLAFAVRDHAGRELAIGSRAIHRTAVLANEVGAWKRAASMMKTRRQKVALVKSSIGPLMSYANFPLRYVGSRGLMLTGAALIAHGVFKKGDQNGK